MNKTDILSLINKSDALTMEVFRRADVKSQIQRPCSIASTPIAVTKKKSNSVCLERNSIDSIVDATKVKLAAKSSTESKRKHLTFSKEEVIYFKHFIIYYRFYKMYFNSSRQLPTRLTRRSPSSFSAIFCIANVN